MFIHKLPPFENVIANGTAVLPRLPLGQMYDAIVLKLGGTTFTKALITAVRLYLNGKMFWNLTGSQIDTINKYRKLTDAAAYLPIWFSDPRMLSKVEQQIGAIDTSRGIENFSIECEIGAATAPTLAAWARLSPPSPKGDRFANAIRAMLKIVQAPAASGEYSLPVSLGSRSGAFIKSNYFFGAGAAQTKLQVLRDGLNLLQEGEEPLLDFMQAELNRAAQANVMVFDPAENDSAEDFVPTLRRDGSPASFEYKVTVSGAETINAISDLITTIDRV